MRRRVIGAIGGLVFLGWVNVSAQDASYPGTRWEGLAGGSYAVGFEFRSGVDPTRMVGNSGRGTPIGMALWYPATAGLKGGAALTQLDYRLLQFSQPMSPAVQERFSTGEIDAMVAWRHVGIVELTGAEARAALEAHGRAVRHAAPAAGTFPVVMILGGPYYLATTAELLASHGFLVVAPVRFQDVANDVGTEGFSWYLENGVRDAEWAIGQLQSEPRADTRALAVVAHGGGGAQATLLAMRHRGVTSVVTLDSAIFSERSALRTVPFFSPRLMRAPFLYIATGSTRETQDQFEDFETMRFSQRYEVTLRNQHLRHHDLSDFGRAVTAPLHLRGPAAASIAADYAEVHRLLTTFLLEAAGRPSAAQGTFGTWLRAHSGNMDTWSVRVYDAVAPAPTLVEAEQRIGPGLEGELRQAHGRDPSAPIFQPSELLRLVGRAIDLGDHRTSVAVAEFAAGLHPRSVELQALRSEALEASGHRDAARMAAAACASMPAGTDWRAAAAASRCRARSERLSP